MKITNRDKKLFLKLASHGMLSTKQATRLIFNAIASTTVLRRLRILEENYFLKRITGLNSYEVLWVLTEKGANEVSVSVPKKNWSKNILEHDYKLLSLRLKLEKAGIARSWIPEHEIRSLIYKKYGLQEGKQKLIPDGLMGTVAIELELTLKNQSRIKEIVSRYQDKKELTAVWYIASSQSILKSFFREWSNHKGFNHSLKLYGSLLEDVLDDPLEATVFREGTACKIKDLWKIQAAHPPAQSVSNQIPASREEEKRVTQQDQKKKEENFLQQKAVVITDLTLPTL
jgi:DNA-binding Lrp family transcriptional regulator